MKFKVLKKVMVLCMSFSLAFSAIPEIALAAGTQTSAEKSIYDLLGVAPGEEGQSTRETGDSGVSAGIHTRPQTEPVTTHPGVNAPQYDAQPDGDTTGRQVREIATDILAAQGLTDGVDYTLANGKYTILKKVNANGMIDSTKVYLDGMTANEIEVAPEAILDLTVSGTKVSTIERLSGSGTVIINSASNGKLKIGEVTATLENLKVQGGTIFGKTATSQINCPKITYSGGSIACNVAAATVIQDALGTSLHRYTIGTVEKNAVCSISDLKRIGTEDISDYSSNGIWSNENGQVTLVMSEDIKNYTFTLTSRAFEVTNEKSTVTAKDQKYVYEQGKVEMRGSQTVAYKVIAGAELKTVYGQKAEDTSALTIEKGKSSDFKVEGIGGLRAEAMENEGKLLQGDEGKASYIISQPNEKEIPSDTPYEFTTVLKVTDKMGYVFEISGPVTLQVDKAELTPVLSAEKPSTTDDTTTTSLVTITKVYDGKKDVPADVIFTLSFKGAVTGDVVSGMAESYAYNNENATASLKEGESTKVVASGISLDDKKPGDNWSNYYKLKKETAEMNGRIEKAPCSKATVLKEPVLTKSDVTLTYDKITIQGIAGQEYSYKSASGSRTQWTACTNGQAMTISNTEDETKVSPDTEYTIYTRVAERDNYEASEEISITVKTPRAPYKFKKKDVSISGITDDGTYTVGTELTLTATGAKPDVKNKDLMEGDEKLVPYSWKLSKTNTWKKSPYTAKITPDKEGKYTVVVKFHKYVYDGNEWVRKKSGDVQKSVKFKATNSSSGSSSGSSSSGSGYSSGSSTYTAANTGDNTPLILFGLAFVASAVVLILLNRKKKVKK